MRLYLIRHPPPAIAPGICYGQTDLALLESVSETAERAARLRTVIPTQALIFSSPLQRCRVLADALSDAVQSDSVQSDTRLMEMHFGAWEMQSWESIGKDALQRWSSEPLHFAPPGGESVEALRVRAVEFCESLRSAAHSEAVLVAHAGIVKVLLGHYCALPTAAWLRHSPPYGSVTWIDTDSGRYEELIA
jgi:alpha-ribazole phosphatase